ncbi:MAG: MarR family transcriptional regulator [Candidatus Obscuribacterales bacterium]|nr:MarR family transcriptional regulator [Candidatus Obscuribacterales bacterium]
MPRLPRKGSSEHSRQQKEDSSKSASAADTFEAANATKPGPVHSSAGEGAPGVVPACLTHSAGYLMNYNAKIIRERLEAALEPLHLSLRELGIMRILESEGPLLQNELGKRQGIDRTSVVQLVDQLEKRELVQRSQNRDDRRSKFLFLTPRGRKTLSQAVRLVEKEQKSFLSPLSAAEWETMRILLLKLLSSHLLAESQDSNGV